MKTPRQGRTKFLCSISLASVGVMDGHTSLLAFFIAKINPSPPEELRKHGNGGRETPATVSRQHSILMKVLHEGRVESD